MATSTDEDIQRVLFLGRVHCYAIPPLQNTKGYKASDWNIESPTSVIFTARLRVIETSDSNGGNIRTDIKLEDPNTGDLFANGPYEGQHCLTPVLDSSRFFALRVVDGPRRAFLGIGFEERSDAFDLGVCLQEVRRHNNMDGEGVAAKKAAAALIDSKGGEEGKDYSLKEGETISITIGNKGRRRQAPTSPQPAASSDASSNFPLPFLPPPPSADDVKKKRQSVNGQIAGVESMFAGVPQSGAKDSSGFDDDPFGDFV